ncbi:hypothetical protein B0H11DRAFT_1930570 [Mycena galericulata]|nr:hypothetical protein B0H11DRAFT_1930570 [Mycena galericulata]
MARVYRHVLTLPATPWGFSSTAREFRNKKTRILYLFQSWIPDEYRSSWRKTTGLTYVAAYSTALSDPISGLKKKKLGPRPDLNRAYRTFLIPSSYPAISTTTDKPGLYVNNFQCDGINDKATTHTDTTASSHMRGRKSIVPLSIPLSKTQKVGAANAAAAQVRLGRISELQQRRRPFPIGTTRRQLRHLQSSFQSRSYTSTPTRPSKFSHATVHPTRAQGDEDKNGVRPTRRVQTFSPSNVPRRRIPTLRTGAREFSEWVDGIRTSQGREFEMNVVDTA